jgi:hypothetical protein
MSFFSGKSTTSGRTGSERDQCGVSGVRSRGALPRDRILSNEIVKVLVSWIASWNHVGIQLRRIQSMRQAA